MPCLVHSGASTDAAVAVLEEEAHVAWIDDDGAMRWAVVDRLGGIDATGNVLDGVAGLGATEVALTARGDRVVFAWIAEHDGRTSIHAGEGRDVVDAASRAAELEAPGALRLALASGSADWIAWTDDFVLPRAGATRAIRASHATPPRRRRRRGK